MNRFTTITRNVSFLSVSMVINKLSGMFIYIALARYIGQASVGKFGFALSFTTLLNAISDLGLNTVVVRTVAQDSAQLRKYLGNLILLRAILSAIAILATGLVIGLSDLAEDTNQIVWITAWAVFFGVVSMGYRWVFQAVEKLQYEALLAGGEGLLLIAGWFAALTMGYGLLGVVLVRLGVSLIICLWGLFLVARHITIPAFDLSSAFWRTLFISAAPFMLMALFNRIYYNIDTVFLGYMKGEEETGRYLVAYRFITLFQMIIVVFQSAVYPAVLKAVNASPEEFQRVIQRALRYAIILSFWISLIITLYAEPFLQILYGDSYENAASILRILIWANFFALITLASNSLLLAYHEDRLLVKIGAVNLTINLVVNLALIPSYGAEGAAIAIMLSEGAGFLLSLIATGRRMHNLRLYDLLGRPAGVALVSAIPALWLGEIHALISAGLISGVYIALSLFAGVIPENDRRMAFNTLKERV